MQNENADEDEPAAHHDPTTATSHQTPAIVTC